MKQAVSKDFKLPNSPLPQQWSVATIRWVVARILQYLFLYFTYLHEENQLIGLKTILTGQTFVCVCVWQRDRDLPRMANACVQDMQALTLGFPPGKGNTNFQANPTPPPPLGGRGQRVLLEVSVAQMVCVRENFILTKHVEHPLFCGRWVSSNLMPHHTQGSRCKEKFCKCGPRADLAETWHDNYTHIELISSIFWTSRPLTHWAVETLE